MKLLDLFCGAGGAAMGYHHAGFTDIVGVDINPQPRYPFTFVQGDALEYLAKHGHEFDVIHASPPCQRYSVLKNIGTYDPDDYPDLILETRSMLIATDKSYVIENVPSSPMINPLVLCGSMFGLPLIRHRLFETNPEIYFAPAPHSCRILYTNSKSDYSAFDKGATAITVAGNNYPLTDGKIAMGIDWMVNRKELSEAIPPAYTEYIGNKLIEKIRGMTHEH